MPRAGALPQAAPGAPVPVPATELAPAGFRALGCPFPQDGAVLVRDGGAVVAAAFVAPGPPRSLRLHLLAPDPDDAALDAAAALAARAGAEEIRTQGKLAPDGAAAARLRAHGLAETAPSALFEIGVGRAALGLARRVPADRLGPGLRLASLAEADPGPLADAIEAAELMDGFELRARLALPGPGGIDAGDCPALLGPDGPCGAILVQRTERADTREIAVRWVAPRWQRLPLANLALLRDALARAHDAGVTRARFRANPERHGDTLALARRLGGREVGRTVGFRRALARGDA